MIFCIHDSLSKLTILLFRVFATSNFIERWILYHYTYHLRLCKLWKKRSKLSTHVGLISIFLINSLLQDHKNNEDAGETKINAEVCNRGCQSSIYRWLFSRFFEINRIFFSTKSDWSKPKKRAIIIVTSKICWFWLSSMIFYLTQATCHKWRIHVVPWRS